MLRSSALRSSAFVNANTCVSISFCMCFLIGLVSPTCRLTFYLRCGLANCGSCAPEPVQFRAVVLCSVPSEVFDFRRWCILLCISINSIFKSYSMLFVSVEHATASDYLCVACIWSFQVSVLMFSLLLVINFIHGINVVPFYRLGLFLLYILQSRGSWKHAPRRWTWLPLYI